jgi:NADH-quinone oxidoreductase subunit E
MNNHFTNEEEEINVKDKSVKNIIRVCRGTICHVKNSANILKTLENELDIKAGEITKDKNFAIEIVTCIDACSISPIISINDDYYGRITIKEIPKILGKYKKDDAVKNKIVQKVSV